MRTLIAQIVKFGVVGVIALIIDMAVMNALIICVHMPSVPAGFISFIISLIFSIFNNDTELVALTISLMKACERKHIDLNDSHVKQAIKDEGYDL